MKIPKIFKNFFLITGLMFILWIGFFDANDLITQYQRKQTLEKLEQTKKYYENEGKKIEKELKDLRDNPQTLEKFAREKYYLRKPKEEVYILIKKDTTKND